MEAIILIIWVYIIALPFIAFGWLITGELDNFNTLTTIATIIMTFIWIYGIYYIFSKKNSNNNQTNIQYKEQKKENYKTVKPKFKYTGNDNSFNEK